MPRVYQDELTLITIEISQIGVSPEKECLLVQHAHTLRSPNLRLTMCERRSDDQLRTPP